jgi:hypothetical protein
MNEIDEEWLTPSINRYKRAVEQSGLIPNISWALGVFDIADGMRVAGKLPNEKQLFELPGLDFDRVYETLGEIAVALDAASDQLE